MRTETVQEFAELWAIAQCGAPGHWKMWWDVVVRRFFIFTCRGVTIDGVWIGWLNLLTPYALIQNYKQLQHYRWSTHFKVDRCTHTSVLRLHLSYPGNGFQHSNYTSLTVTAAHMKSSLHSLIPFLPFLFNHLRLPFSETPSILLVI
jgi:hypothetical protein